MIEFTINYALCNFCSLANFGNFYVQRHRFAFGTTPQVLERVTTDYSAWALDSLTRLAMLDDLLARLLRSDLDSLLSLTSRLRIL